MRLLRFVVLVAVVAMVGWAVVPSVSVESNDETLRIIVDRQKLRQAGHTLKDKGRAAAEEVGKALQVAGRKLEDAPEAK
ncbi:MAG: hypothetical protein DWQ37_16550 [Planctomycetota bacterium]|nr:MAG: hypothetical protein DWQ37_16550 [Planctomycetota bacterium]